MLKLSGTSSEQTMRTVTSVIAFASAALALNASAQSSIAPPRVLVLDRDSSYSDRCTGPCACPTVLYPLHGKLITRLTRSDMSGQYFDVQLTDWRTLGHTISGSGTYVIGGDFALTQRMLLNVMIDGQPKVLDSGTLLGLNGAITPGINISVSETPPESVCNFVVLNLELVLPCSIADVNGLGAGAYPDGRLTVDDVITFIHAFFADDGSIADVASLGGRPIPDGQLTSDDVIAFLSAFFAGGCN
jgi:hypothetical protein